MVHNNTNEDEQVQKSLKIEETLPVKTVSIESLKESHTDTMSPHRRIFKWFARRPTATTRLAVLASLLPNDMSDDSLLRLMQVGPNERIDTSIEEYVLKKHSTSSDRNGSVEDHFEYEYPHKRVPTKPELDQFHERVREQWDGSLPTVVDPTAGGGTIPFEAMRYGLPTVSNELNPVAWLINKTILDFAPSVGSVASEIDQWMDRVERHVEQELTEYFPSKAGVPPEHYFRCYSIVCPSCGERIPISNRWWFHKPNGIAVRPIYDKESLDFEIVEVPDEVSKDEFDPSKGTVAGGDAECPHCDVVTVRDDLVEYFNSGNYQYEVCGVRYEEDVEGARYHPPTEEDREAVRRAKERVENDLELSTLLRTTRYLGYYDRSEPYGVEQWRDLYSPRQLLTHSAYLDAFEDIKPEIVEKYDGKTAKTLLTLLSFIPVKSISHNSRLAPIRATYGRPSDLVGNNGYFFQWHFGESNMMSGTFSYQSEATNVLKNYQKVVGYVDHLDDPDVVVNKGDAASLDLEDSSTESIIIDPPYGDNVMYAEMADCFYVWFREYLGDVFTDAFRDSETNKEDEAVENPVIVEASDGESTSEVARERYEDKMSDIFSEAYRVLEAGGVLTIYFTDKEIDAWDSLTMSIIRSGFNVTATHTITSEMPARIAAQENASADSTLLLTCRKPVKGQSERPPTLWDDIKDKTREAAREKATELLDSSYNLTKTDTIISAFGPTLRVFTENYPVVDNKDEEVRPREALREARTAVTSVLIDRELEGSLDDADPLTTWYILSWLTYEEASIPFDEARQLGLGVGVEIDKIKRDTKIWSKSGDSVVLAGQGDRVQDYSALESGEKRRKRKYPIDPRDTTFTNHIDAVHAALNVLETKGGDYTLKWLDDRDIQSRPWFSRVTESLLQVLPEDHEDRQLVVNLSSGQTGQHLDVDRDAFTTEEEATGSKQAKLDDV